MISLETICWFAAGIAVGVLHATMLWRATHRLSAWTPMTGLLRLGVVTSVLIISALAGGIVMAAAGWAVGFAVVGTWFVVKRTHGSVAARIIHSRGRRSHMP